MQNKNNREIYFNFGNYHNKDYKAKQNWPKHTLHSRYASKHPNRDNLPSKGSDNAS